MLPRQRPPAAFTAKYPFRLLELWEVSARPLVDSKARNPTRRVRVPLQTTTDLLTARG